MKDITKKYSNGEVTIVWKPNTCIHSTICWKHATGLPGVFNPAERPWIKPEAATTSQIIDQVKKCPSGALTYFMNGQAEEVEKVTTESIVEVVPDGPLLVYGNITIKDKDGKETKSNKVTAFCRCGQSGNKPYCDGTHKKVEFKG
jgi:uncharacterized Fe-S cluster protein YjdI